MVEENVEAKIDVSCCVLEVRVVEKLAELTSSVEVIIKPLSELTHNSIVETVDTYLGEKKGKEKRRLKVTVHNVPESTSDEDQERKQQDTDEVNYIFQKYPGVMENITRAVGFDTKGTRPRLLMVQRGNKQEKAVVIRNCTKLRNENNPDEIKKVLITPDLTPKQRQKDKALRAELSEKKHCIREQQIHYKKREDSAEGTHSRTPHGQCK